MEAVPALSIVSWESWTVCISMLPHPATSYHPKTLVADKGVPSGVKSYDVSIDTQTAIVHAEPSLGYGTVLETIKKTGKTVISGEADGEKKSVELEEFEI